LSVSRDSSSPAAANRKPPGGAAEWGRPEGKNGEYHGKRGELILATSTVEDFDRWLKIFSTKSVGTRKQHGSKGSTVFCDPNEDGRVWVLFDWDEEDWKNFISDPDFPDWGRMRLKKPAKNSGLRVRALRALTRCS
jgi:hypothetical protein